MQNFEMTFTDHIEATRRAAELVAEGVTAKYVGLWDGLYVVEYQANERRPERTLPVTPEPEPEMQYINRRESDGALWPTFCPIQSEGWVQIGAVPIAGRHEVGDTVLIYDRFPKPERGMERGTIVFNDRPEDGVNRIKTDSYSAIFAAEILINFSKGDHLSESEREAWHQEASRFQDSYYSTFKP